MSTKTTNYLKIVTFFIVMIPGKIMTPNILGLISSIFSVISNLFVGDYNIVLLYFTIITILTTISIIFFFL